jgi:hypothetical protein
VNLRGRLRRAERALWRLEPRDPRKELAAEEVKTAATLLEALGAAPPSTLRPEERSWLETALRPRLPQWLAYEARRRRWDAAARVAWRAAQRRVLQRTMCMPPSVESPVFTENGRRAARTLLGLPPDPAAAVAAG